MKFVTIKTKVVDFKNLKENQVANATVKSFDYVKGHCFVTLVGDDNSTIRTIMGPRAEHPIKDMLDLKGQSVQVTFGGTNTAQNDKVYPKYYLSF